MLKRMTFLTFLIPTLLMAAPTTKLRMIDSCTKRETFVAGPSSIQGELLITGLNTDEDVEVQVDFYPIGIIEDLSRKDHIVENFTIKKYKEGKSDGRINQFGKAKVYFDFPDHKMLYEIEQKNQTARIWNIQVQWTQESDKILGGSAFANVYRAVKEGETFYQILKPEFCSWESDAAVSSKLHKNETNSLMNIIHEYRQVYAQGVSNGIALGVNSFNTNFDSAAPLVSMNGNVLFTGWYFKEWQKQLTKQQFISVERKFVLSRYSSGVFAKRKSFNRKEVARWKWVKRPGFCGQYQIVDKGFLDVGVDTEDFYELPRNFHGDDIKMNEFIKLTRPTIDTCPMHLNKGAEFATDIALNGIDGIMFYYKK